MKLFHNGGISKVVLILLWSHVVGREDVLLEHELFWIFLTFAENTLVGATIGPVVLADPDGVGG